MKRFLVFAGSHYYPLGGWQDFRGDFDELEHAKERGKKAALAAGRGDCWWHVIDTETRATVASDRWV